VDDHQLENILKKQENHLNLYKYYQEIRAKIQSYFFRRLGQSEQ